MPPFGSALKVQGPDFGAFSQQALAQSARKSIWFNILGIQAYSSHRDNALDGPHFYVTNSLFIRELTREQLPNWCDGIGALRA
jgi:hypothetical protein